MALGPSSAKTHMGDLRPSPHLEAVLLEARRRSLIGGAAIKTQVAHAQAFLRVLLLEELDGPILELGAGGGLPGLVLAFRDRRLRLVLIDSARRSADFLLWAIDELGISERVEVLNVRAEELGRDDAYRGRFVAVVARSFGPPGVTAECAAPFLRVGGRLIVAEPPSGASGLAGSTSLEAPSPDRWPIGGCLQLGLTPESAVSEPFAFAVLRQSSPCPQRYPRRSGIPTKRPLFPQGRRRTSEPD
jgi:16S rRNA (guanine527-N7)-methyltransferase